MGNYCCECNNKNIDDGNLGSSKIKYKEEKKKINKITTCDTKIIENSIPNLINNNSNNSKYNNEQNILINPPILPNKIISDNIINSTKKLILIIIQSKYLTEGKEYIINAGGLIGSQRNIKDGITYFGDKSVSYIIIINKTQLNHKNDFEFPDEESNTGQSWAEIKYDIISNQYQIKSLRGSGCFVKIENKIVNIIFLFIYLFIYIIQLLENGDLFSFSNFLIEVKIDIISEEKNDRNIVTSTLLTLEVLFGENEQRKISFDSKNNKLIHIGRLQNNETDVVFLDEDVSRKQCILFYEENNWYINDGDGETKSSNGTWFYPEKLFNIFDNMIIRMGTTSFLCKFES